MYIINGTHFWLLSINARVDYLDGVQKQYEPLRAAISVTQRFIFVFIKSLANSNHYIMAAICKHIPHLQLKANSKGFEILQTSIHTHTVNVCS